MAPASGEPRRREVAERSASADQLIRRNWSPVYRYVRTCRRLGSEDARDLTQQFFTMLLERRDLERLSPERGSVPAFLRTALHHFLVSAERSRRVRQPRASARLLRLDEACVSCARLEPAAGPERDMDREWSVRIVSDAIARLESILRRERKDVQFEVFREYCLAPAGLSGAAAPKPPSYAHLAARYGISEDHVDNALRSVRLRVKAVLREVLSERLGPGEDIETELRALLSR